MRLSLLSLLLLTAAAPALAADPNPDDPVKEAEQPRAPERRFEPPRRSQQIRDGVDDTPPRVADRAERFEPRQAAPDSARDIPAAPVTRSRGGDWSRPTPAADIGPRPDAGRQDRGWRERNVERTGRVRDVPPAASAPVYGSAVPSPVTVTERPREVSPGSIAAGNLRDRIAAEGLRRDRIERDNNWRRDWRHDHRYDWRRHRDRDRARFHLGIYIDPFGWRYRDYDIGWRLPARYYSSRYWIADPWYYRLPPVGGPYRWIRYHDDVLLVDLRSGRVLDRIRNFFW